MGRRKKEDIVRLTVRIPTALQAELFIRRPELLSASYTAKYGGMTEYICKLIRQDLYVAPPENIMSTPIDR